MVKILLPLPPLAEQHRIVAKIDRLMTLCDELERQIDAAESKQTNLLNSVVTTHKDADRAWASVKHDKQEKSVPSAHRA